MCATDGIIYPGFPYKNKDDNSIILPDIEEQMGHITTECLRTLVVFIGGAADDDYQPMLKGVFSRYAQDYGQGKERKQDVCYSEHGGGNVPPVMQKWRDANQKIVLVGHSWGGDRVICLAEDNTSIPIELLVTLDPVSRGKSGKQTKPVNVKRWMNIYVDYKFADYSSPNDIARAGGAWEECSCADMNKAINVGEIQNESGRKIISKMNDYGHADADVMFSEVIGDVNVM